MENKFYVYKWFIIDTQEVFYIGKGTRNRKNSISNRNKIFKEYYSKYNCKNEIIQYFENEKDALQYEKEMIAYYRSLGQAKANIDEGGNGGLSFSWTSEMREYKSKYNPMKELDQRKRMSENNPMYRKDVLEKAHLRGRPVIINGIEYPNVHTAANENNVYDSTVCYWCKRGYNTNGQPCRYKDEEQKDIPEMKKLGARVNNAKPVIIDNIYYPSVKLGAEAIGGNSENLIRAIKANRKYKNHTCSYANQQPNQENNQ